MKTKNILDKILRLRNLGIVAICAIVFGMFAGGYIALAKGIPSIEELKQYKVIPGTRIYADDDTLIGELKVEKGTFVPLNRMPQYLINAVISVEDSRFWKHNGIDYIAIMRAAVKDVLHVGLKEGGSTITQQLAKITFLSPQKTLGRKIREIALAMKIEKKLSKKEILELYLNRVYMGHGAYGMERAAEVYFGKSVKDVNLPEAALLAGIIRAPSAYSPYNNLTAAKERQETVLMRMQEEGYIKPSEKERAEKQPLHLSALRGNTESDNYFVEYVRKYLEEKYGVDVVYKGGLNVYTTLDRKAQIAAAGALRDGLRDLDKRRGWRGAMENRKVDVKKEMSKKVPADSLSATAGDMSSGIVLKVTAREAIIKARGVLGRLRIENARWARTTIDPGTGRRYYIKDFSLNKILKVGDIVKVSFKSSSKKSVDLTLEQDPKVEGAIVSMDPATGYIKAMVGGYDYATSEFNRALYAKRQPGSAFKPLIYAAAMDNGFTPASVIDDEPVTYNGGPRGEWSPENYDHKHYGPTRLRDALAYSRNVVTVKLVDKMGVDKVIDFARTLGFEGAMPHNLSIALGSISITPMELCEIYSVFADQGTRMTPIAIKYITDSQGRVVESNEPEGREVISPDTAFLITSMMEDVVKYGTGWRAKSMGRPVAGKTGTTNDYRDAWFVGYTTDLLTCVWVGSDDMHSLGSLETGARAASPIWLSYMKTFDTGDSTDFAVPQGIVRYAIDPSNGLLSRDGTSGITEYFKEGTQPTAYSPSQSRWEIKEPTKNDFD